ncbi:hypothetical protein [Actinoplanes sp. NPDC023714]|uniref:hypothetical protein n=1 Tax=Actinoplanes sp. NPDC023714 TaxID=3154322 RepID=UPI0033CF42C9
MENGDRFPTAPTPEADRAQLVLAGYTAAHEPRVAAHANRSAAHARRAAAHDDRAPSATTLLAVPDDHGRRVLRHTVHEQADHVAFTLDALTSPHPLDRAGGHLRLGAAATLGRRTP